MFFCSHARGQVLGDAAQPWEPVFWADQGQSNEENWAHPHYLLPPGQSYVPNQHCHADVRPDVLAGG